MSQSGIYNNSTPIPPGTYVETLTGNDGTIVGPSALGNINVVGDGTTTYVTGNAGTNTETITLHGITQYDVQVGGASNTLANVSPSTAGFVLTSNGISSNPSFQGLPGSSISITGDSGGAQVGNAFTFTASGIGLSFAGAADIFTLGGTLLLANGGTSASLTANNGGIFYSTATAGAILAGTATARQMLQSGASTTPAWSTATWPATTTIDQLLYSSANNVVGGVTAGNYGVLISSSTGVPSWLANGTTGQLLTATTAGTPSWENPAASSISITGDSGGALTGAAFTFTGASTGLTFAGSGSTETLTGTLVVGNGGTGATTLTSHGVLLGNTTSPITATAAGTTGQVLTGVTGSAPTFQSPAASSISITGDSGGALTGAAFTFTGGTTGLSFGGAGSTETLSGTLAVANGGTGATNLTGVVTANNGTGPFTASAVTQYDVLVGAASNLISSVGPGTALQVLQSGGNAANPAYSTATYPATTTINQLLYSSSNNVVGGVTAGNYGVLISSSAGVPSWLTNGTTGQVLTATTSGIASWAAAAAGGITTINGDTGSVTGSTVTITGGTTGLTFGGSGTTDTLGGTLVIANGGTNATSFTQSNGIVTYNGTRLVNYAGPQISSGGLMTNTSQPAFLYYLGTTVSGFSGTGTPYTIGSTQALTKVFDNDSNFSTSGVFTAPVTGIYNFYFAVLVLNCTIASECQMQLIPSTGSSYSTRQDRNASNNNFGLSGSFIINLTSGTTVTFVLDTFGEVSNTNNLQGAQANTWFGGNLIC